MKTPNKKYINKITLNLQKPRQQIIQHRWSNLLNCVQKKPCGCVVDYKHSLLTETKLDNLYACFDT